LHGLIPPDTGVTQGVFHSESNQIISVVAQEYKPVEQMSVLSMRALLKFLRIYQQYKAQSLDKTKSLVAFINYEVLEKVVYNEKHINSSISEFLNMETIFRITDANLLSAFARALRPQTRTEYAEQMFSTVTKFKPADEYDIKTGCVNWDRAMAMAVTRVCEEFQEIDKVWRLDLTDKDSVDFPSYTYGSDKNPGVFYLLFQCFGKYKDNLITGSGGLPIIKSLETLEEVIKRVMEFNSFYSLEAKRSRANSSKISGSETVGAIYESVITRIGSNQVKFPRPVSNVVVHMGAVGLEPDLKDSVSVNEDVFEENGELMPITKMPPTKPPEKGPCFRLLNTGKCEMTNCPFSHEDKVIDAEVDRLFSESPYFRRNLNKHRLPPKSPVTQSQSPYTPLNRSPAFERLNGPLFMYDA
jgi:hypothetical protein